MASVHDAIDTITDDDDQSTPCQSGPPTPSTESEQLSEAWTHDIVETFEKQGINIEEVEVTTNPDTPNASTTPDIPLDLKEEAEKEHAKVYKTTWEELPENIQNWIKAHPYQTAFHVVSGVVFFAPAAASGPVLYLLGFGSLGPRAASFATFWQSKIGVVAAKSGFAFMQSAGMGGYGLAAVNTVAQISAAVGSLGTGLWGWVSGNGDAEADTTLAVETGEQGAGKGTTEADENTSIEVDKIGSVKGDRI